MVAIFTGAGAGFERGSGSVLGKAGLLGSSALGRGGEQLFVNAANGNLVINRQDEFLVGRGPDVAIARTYNSLADVGDDNNDQWRQSTDRRIVDLTGTLNTTGSTVKRVAGDGSVSTYAWNGAAYVTPDGAGAYDKLTYNSSTWTWTDGDSQITETYNADWRIATQSDTSGNALAFTYDSGGQLTRITTATPSGTDYIDYIWNDGHIDEVKTSYKDFVSNTSKTLTRTRYGYDSENRLSTVTVDLSPEDNSVADEEVYTTTYTYVSAGSKLVETISQTDGSQISIDYDSWGRVDSYAQTVASGVSRTTIFGYYADYTTITDPAGQVTRLDFASGDMATDVATWDTTNLIRTAVTINGDPATELTVAANGWSAASKPVAVAAGDTVTFGLTIQGVGSTSTYYLGLYGDGSAGFGKNGQSSARIVSGPGQIAQWVGGGWAVTGVSNSQPTRIEITRTYVDAQNAIARIYPDMAGEDEGTALIVADATLLKSATATTLSSMDLTNWGSGGVDRTSDSDIDGLPAYKFTVQSGATSASSYTSLIGGTVKAGETFTFSLSLKAVGTATSQLIGLYGDSSYWGANSGATARIVSGPGSISQYSGGLFTVSGLSTTSATRIEITRHYTQDETGGAYMLVDHVYGVRAGAALIASAPHLVKRIVEPAAARQLTKITTPPPQSGGTAQVVEFGYNAKGDLASVIDPQSQTASYAYDANGNLLTSTDRLGNVVTRTYGSKNELLTETRTGADSSGAANAHTTRFAYDSANRQVYSVSAEGQVARYWYDSAGQLYFTSAFPDHFYDVSALSTSTAISKGDLDDWCTSLPSGSTTTSPVSYTYFDGRGNVERSRRFNVPTSYAAASETEGYSDVTYRYDQAGQLLSRTAKDRNTETFVYDGLGRLIASTDLNGGTTNFVFTDNLLKTEVKIGTHLIQTSTTNKAGELVSLAKSGDYVTTGTASYQYDRNGRLRVATDASGRKTWFVYDAVGRKLADVRQYSTTAFMTEYRYDTNDRLVATVNHAIALSSTQIAALDDVSADPQIASVRPTANSSDLWAWQVYDAEGRVVEAIDGDGGVTAYAYDGSSRLVRTIGYATKLSSTTIDGFKTTLPTASVAPSAHADDAVTRSFFDKDGRLVGVLDGEGYLSRTVYDKAGRIVEEVAFLTATGTSLRASGTFAQLLTSVGTSAGDRRTRYVYDGQNHLRFVIDSLNQVIGHTYEAGTAGDSHSEIRTTVQYAETIAPSSYTYVDVQDAVDELTHVDDRVSLTIYDAAGRIAYAVDPGGAVTGYSYDLQGRVTRTVRLAATFGLSILPTKSAMDTWVAAAADVDDDRVTRNYYSDRGELRFAVDAEGYVTRFDYDAEGRVLKEVRWTAAVTVGDTTTIAQVESAVASGTWIDKQYGYHASGQLASVTDGEGAVTAYEYSATGKLSYERRAYGTADVSTTAYGYDGAGRLLARYDAEGAAEQTSESYGYDAFGNLIAVTDAKGTTARSYDQLGQLLSEGRGGATAYYEYNSFGEVAKATDRNGNASYNYYDQLGRVTVARDAESYLTETSYTLFGEVESVTRRYNQTTATPSTTTVPTATAHAKDATTSFLYDKLGRVEQATDAEDKFELYWYDAFGNRIQVQNKLGGTTEYAYYKSGRLRHERVDAPVFDGAGDETASGYYTHVYSYDARGNLKQDIEAYGRAEQRTTVYTYDKADRLTRIDHPEVLVYNPGTDSSAAVTPYSTFAYDRRGNRIEAVDANGGRTFSYYDDLDRKSVEIDALGTYRSWSYDGNGNVLSEKAYGTKLTSSTTPALPTSAGGAAPGAPTTGEVRETTHTYDALNRLETTVIASLRTGAWTGSAYASSVGTVTMLGLDYDHNGNVTRSVDGSGAEIHSYYDKRGHKYAEVDQENYLTYWSLDAEGNILSERRYATAATGSLATIPSVSTSAGDRVTMFEYDRNGRRTKETREATGAYAFAASTGAAIAALTGTAADSVIEYAYNELGQVRLKTHSSGETITSVYDDSGRLREEYKTGYADHNNATVTPSLTYYYDALGNVVRTVQATYEGGGAERVTIYSYAHGGRLHSVFSADGAVHTLHYDKMGNVLRDEMEHHRANGDDLSSNRFVAYDALGRAISEYNRDAIEGVWQTATPTVTTVYNAYGEVASTAIGGVTQAENLYDLAGRLWATSAGDGAWKLFGYDGAGHQTAAIASAGYNLSGVSFSDALGLVSGATVNATWTVVDKRGQAVKTIEEGRQLTSSTSPDLVREATYNAFGEVASEKDANLNVTNYYYNSMGRLIEKRAPTVDYTNASGTVVTSVRPTETYFYDIVGRMIGRKDANATAGVTTGFTTWRYLAGTGLDGGQGLVTFEYHPDGGDIETRYDRFGDAREIDNELNQQETREYDDAGRVTSILHRGGLLTDHYSYDGLGRQLTHWNSLLTSSDAEITDYDTLGRVTSQRAYGGDTTTTTYAWSASIATTGIGTFGGWTETTTFANGKTLVETSDAYGRVTAKTDLGTNSFTYSYDLGGRRLAQSGAFGLTYTYFNTGQLAGVTEDSNNYATYTYDANGNKKTELTVRGGVTVQDAKADYDGLNRLIRWDEFAGGTGPTDRIARLDYAYDLNGNIRHAYSERRILDHNGAVGTSAQTWNDWYLYDNMNRVVRDKGNLISSAITGGTLYSYNAAGQRVTATNYVVGLKERVWAYSPMPTFSGPTYYYHSSTEYDDRENYQGEWIDVTYSANRKETYTYNTDGTLASVHINQDPLSFTDGQTTLPAAGTMSGSGALKASYDYDAMGRLTEQTDWAGNGSDAAYNRLIHYDGDGRIDLETTFTKQGADTWKSEVTNYYVYGGVDALGSVVRSTTVDSKAASGSSTYTQQYTTVTSNTYAWHDGAVLDYLTYAKTQSGTTTTWNTDYTLNGAGHLTSATISDGRPRTVTYTNDLNGLAIRRDEADSVSWNSSNNTGGDPHEIWYRYNGRQMGFTGNNGSLDTDYTTSIAARTQVAPSTPGAFNNGAAQGQAAFEFDPSLQRINSFRQGGAGGAYTVRAGDTLQSVATALWGDPELWYKLAEANGLGAGAALTEGRTLAVPSGIQANSHNASTFRPYDAGDVIGETSPTNPKPRKGNKCGVFGAILLVGVAALVTVVTAGAALAALAPAGMSLGAAMGTVLGGGMIGALGGGVAGTLGAIGIGAAAGAVGSIASQGLGVATGLQDQFSWKGVAMSALSGGIGAGLGGVGPQGSLNLASTMARGAFMGVTSSALSQGIGAVIGLQSKFDFAGVAAAGLGGAASAGLGKVTQGLGRFGSSLAANTAGGIANAAARTLISGGSFGDNLMRALPDVIGTTLGNALAGGIAGTGGGKANGLAVSEADLVAAAAEKEAQGAANLTNKLAAALGSQGPIRLASAGDLQPGLLAQASLTSNTVSGSKRAGTVDGFGTYDIGGATLYTIQNAELFPIVRTNDELFTSTATRAINSLDLDLVINGSFFGFPEGNSSITYGRGLWGPVSPDETRTEGLVVRNGIVVAGSEAPDRHYFAKVRDSDGSTRFEFGNGNPPLNRNVIAAFGGAVPLIVNGRAVGAENTELRNLITRDEATGNSSLGKVIVAYNPQARLLGVIVQGNGLTQGRSFPAMQRLLTGMGFTSALIFDGGSSATAVTRGGVESRPAHYKDGTIGTGIGIRAGTPRAGRR